jgi:hypothetical protein
VREKKKPPPVCKTEKRQRNIKTAPLYRVETEKAI